MHVWQKSKKDNPKTGPTMTLYYPGSVKGKALASSVNSSVGLVLNSRNRGVKEGWYRMDRPGVEDYQGDVDGDENIDYFLAQTTCPAIIFEMTLTLHVSAVFSSTTLDAILKMSLIPKPQGVRYITVIE